ncbi:phospholipid phosphatase 3-like [Saccoglossus kowalevskii]
MAEGKDVPVFTVFLDIFIFLIVEASFLVPYYLNLDLLPTRHRGFTCDDASIQHPKYNQTVPELYVLIGTFAIIIFFVIGELLYYFLHKKKHALSRLRCGSWSFQIHPIVSNIYQMIGLYVFGAGMSFIFVLLTKKMVGKLRPNFMALCQPDFSKINCTDGLILDFTCLGDSAEAEDARQSFPSGHASTSFYCLTFIVIYIEARLIWRGSRLLKTLLQIVCLLVATFISLSRVYDFYHSLGDVIGGAVLGVGIAILMAYHVSSLFGKKSTGIEFEDKKQDTSVEMYNYVVSNRSTVPAWNEYTM